MFGDEALKMIKILFPIFQISLRFDRFGNIFGEEWKERYSCNAFNLTNGIDVKVVAFGGICILSDKTNPFGSAI